MGDGHQPWLVQVLEMVVTALDPDQIPTVRFDKPDQLSAIQDDVPCRWGLVVTVPTKFHRATVHRFERFCSM
jgi:hypothetical protein